MGNVRAKIARLDPLRARIATVVPVDHLVVAGVSELGQLRHRRRARPARRQRSPAHARARAPADRGCVAVGACDGVTRRASHRRTDFRPDTHAAIVDLFRLAAIGVPESRHVPV
jgi:hypothetical protein